MTLSTTTAVTVRFLKDDRAQVLAIKGGWGVGKTYAWKNIVLQNKDQIARANYCYVSLFGIGTISELRTAIVSKTQTTRLLGERLDAAKINVEWIALTRRAASLAGGWIAQYRELPFVKNISVGLEALAPHLIRDTLICLDDFERLTKRIAIDELLGLVSELKEEKNCKIVMIFNESEISEKLLYQKFKEKVVDFEVAYEPTSFQAAQFALRADLPCRRNVEFYAAVLNIKNIRILKKISDIVGALATELKNLHPTVLEKAVSTAVLLAWCQYDSGGDKPTVDFVRGFNRTRANRQEPEAVLSDTQRAAWEKTLSGYGFIQLDEFDLAILGYIEKGYLDETEVAEEAIKLDSRCKAIELEQSFFAAWDLYHYSFSADDKLLVRTLGDALKASILHVSPINLSGTTQLFRDLGYDDEADDLIEEYIKARGNSVALFDLAKNPFAGDIRDGKILTRFSERLLEIQPQIGFAQALEYLDDNKGWSGVHIAALMRATESEYYSYFKESSGKQIAEQIKACLDFENRQQNREIGAKARAALMRLAKESKLNAIRVQRFGIIPD